MSATPNASQRAKKWLPAECTAPPNKMAGMTMVPTEMRGVTCMPPARYHGRAKRDHGAKIPRTTDTTCAVAALGVAALHASLTISGPSTIAAIIA